MASLLTICSLSHSERRALPTKIHDDRARSPTPLRANMYPQRPFPRRPTPQSRSPTPHLYRYCCSSVDPCVRLCLRAYFASGGTPRWFEYTSPVCNGGSRRHPQHNLRISDGCTTPAARVVPGCAIIQIVSGLSRNQSKYTQLPRTRPRPYRLPSLSRPYSPSPDQSL